MSEKIGNDPEEYEGDDYLDYMDYDTVVIYPMDYDKEVRKKLKRALRSLGIRIEYNLY